MHGYRCCVTKIVKTKLINFRRFISGEVLFDRPLTVLVGRNNSGKSTLLEAIGIVLGVHSGLGGIYLNKKVGKTGTAVIELYLRLTESEWNSIITLVQHEFTTTNLNLSSLPSQLANSILLIEWKASYVNGVLTGNPRTIRLEDESMLTQFESDYQNVIRRSIQNFINQNISLLTGVMYLSAERRLQKDEHFIPFDQLKTRADRHELIRNSLYFLKKKQLDKYEQLIDRMQKIFQDIDRIDTVHNEDTGTVDLDFAEGGERSDFLEMGSGTKSLVMILARILSPNTTLALLDEPDINMHPGLVRDLARFLEEISGVTQIIISSHHETFVNEIDRSNILHVHSGDTLTSTVSPLGEDNAVLNILEDLGLFPGNFVRSEATASRVIVLGEGPSDWKYLQAFASKLGMLDKLLAVNPVYFPLGGKKIVDSELLDKINGSPVPFVLVRDRDEYDESQIQRLEEKLGENRLHFLSRREIENYAIEYECLLKTLKEKGQTKTADIKSKVEALTEQSVKTKVKALADELKMKVILMRFVQNLPVLKFLTYDEMGDFVERNKTRNIEEIVNDFSGNIVDKISSLNRDELRGILQEQESQLDSNWTETGVLQLCPGKDLLKSINKWTTEEFGINISVNDLIERLETIDSDISDVINKVINGTQS